MPRRDQDPNSNRAKAIRKVLADLGLGDQPVILYQTTGARKFRVETLYAVPYYQWR